jgi:hypothetical protein
MQARYRRSIERARGVRHFNRARPHPSPGYVAAAGQLDGLLDKTDGLLERKRDGLLEERAANAQKRDLRQVIRDQLGHLIQVAAVAGSEVPDLPQKIVFKPNARTDMALQTAAIGMLAEARAHKDVLVKHGLVESVLDDLAASLEKWDAVMQQAAAGRLAHVGATAELGAVVSALAKIIAVLDGLNRYRFAQDPESLAQWESASNLVPNTPRSAAEKPEGEDTPPAGGETRPAA